MAPKQRSTVDARRKRRGHADGAGSRGRPGKTTTVQTDQSPGGEGSLIGGGKRKPTVQDLVYEELRRSLMTGVFTPGEKISLRRLTEQTGTSMMPVREAVNRLIAERAFRVVPKRQVIVPPMTGEKFDEIVHWRVQLESAAVRAACRKVTPELISRLEEINKQIIEAVESDHKDALLPLNYEFHFTIYGAAQLEVLLPMIESLWLQAGPFTYYSTPSPRALWDVRHHRDLLNALQCGDERAAQEAVTRDIQTAGLFLKRSGHFSKPRVRRVA